MHPAVEWMGAQIELTGAAQLHREEPWAAVWHAPTADGRVWLKVPAPKLAFEAGLYEVLAREVPDRVLTPLAVDAQRGWVVLPDGGPTPNPLAPALGPYAHMQRDLAPHVEALLAAGVHDMRPAILPQRLAEAEAVTGVDCEAIRARFAEECAELATAPGAPSLDHNDLHNENVLAGGRFYDWGDAVVAHPFASLLTPLETTPAEQHGALRDAYLGAWSDLAPRAELERTLALALRVSLPARALVWHRADPVSEASRWTLRRLLDAP